MAVATHLRVLTGRRQFLPSVPTTTRWILPIVTESGEANGAQEVEIFSGEFLLTNYYILIHMYTHINICIYLSLYVYVFIASFFRSFFLLYFILFIFFFSSFPLLWFYSSHSCFNLFKLAKTTGTLTRRPSTRYTSCNYEWKKKKSYCY